MALVTVVLLLSLTLTAVCGIDVNTTVGMVSGYQRQQLGVTVNVFTGIPYAAPPIGDLRFRRPIPLTTRYSTPINATQLPNSCYQLLQQTLGPPNTPLSEDCLYLNVWAPAAASASPRTVMVWIYGGAFNSGTSTLPLYDGTVLAAVGDVVVVSMQYRLGVMGFLYLGIDEAPGNMGLLDQQVALQWVQANIAAFGGDPSKVTIFGESAGGQSVGMHLLSPSSEPLFHQAIMESGVGVAPFAYDPPSLALLKSMEIANLAGCNITENFTAIAECLRQVSPTKLTADMYKIPQASVTILVPTLDNLFLTDSPVNILATSNGLSSANILLGTNQDEGTIFIPAAALPNVPATKDQFAAYAATQPQFANCPSLLVAAVFLYTEPDSMLGLVSDYRSLEGDIIADMGFVCPATATANAYAAHGNKVYRYEFTHRTSSTPAPTWMGVIHSMEVDYVFGTPLASNYPQNFTVAEKALALKVLLYWTNFAKYGDPNQGGDPTHQVTLDPWPLYTVANQTYLMLNTGTLVTGQYLRAQFCAFRSELIPQLTALCNSTSTGLTDTGSTETSAMSSTPNSAMSSTPGTTTRANSVACTLPSYSAIILMLLISCYAT